MTTTSPTASAPAACRTGAAPDLPDAVGRDVIALSHTLHDAPELGFAEHRSVREIAAVLRAHERAVQVGAFGMETALLAAAGDPAGPTVAILAEYDALPDIGHGCGHNIIAASAVGAFLLAAQQVGRTGGQVVLLGTPAEENGAGKELLARAGAFQDVDAVLMIHPMAGRYDVAHFNSLGCRSVRARYHGRSAHASAAPHLGRNALDAAVSSYTGIAALRQHLRPVERIHGVIEDGGGAAPNVVPDHASCIYLVRSDTVPALMDLSDRVEAVLRAAALATGTELDLQWDVAPAYLPVRGNAALAETYAAHARSLGRPLADDLPGPNPPGGSTDLGNVSVRVPAIHATVAVCGPEVPMHSALFAQQAVSAEGDRAVADAAVMRTGQAWPGAGELVRMGPLKIISDGSLGTRTAYCCEPYPGGAGSEFPHGKQNFTLDQQRELLGRAVQHGLDVAVHAIGDAACADALRAIEETGARGSIEQAQLMRADDVRRMSALGLTASVQPAHLLDDRILTERNWPGREDRCFMLRSMLDAGVTLALGSDAPVAPLDPWLAMASAIHRGADGEQPWVEQQAISPAEALAASVDGRGTVQPGSVADLVLLDHDPLAPAADSAAAARQLRGTRAALTMVSGRIVHDQLR